jgi:RNA polymerase sigma-70 factor (ECF subfamily)
MQKEAQLALEGKLAAAFDAGDFKTVATEILRGYGPQILGYYLTTLRDEDRAKDAFAHFAEELWKSLPAFLRQSAFRTWTYTLAWRVANRSRTDAYHARGRRLETHEVSRIAEEVRDQTMTFLRTEAKDTLARLRESLDPEEQTLLFLRIDQKLSWSEIATVLSKDGARIETAALRKRFERLKTTLRERAARAGYRAG